jgi:hypothetical protein
MMPDTPRPTRVIPLHPNRPGATARPVLPTSLLTLLKSVRDSALVRTLSGIRIPGELKTLSREATGRAVSYLAPSLLLALGAGLLGLLAGHVLRALGAGSVDALVVGGTAGRWTLLATMGGALAARGYRLARSRWT